MALTPGFSANYRQPPPPLQSIDAGDGVDVIVDAADEGGDVPEFDDRGAILRIKHGDGSVTVSLDGKPLEEPKKDKPTGSM